MPWFQSDTSHIFSPSPLWTARLHSILICRHNTEDVYIDVHRKTISVVLVKHRTAPWWWFLREPKHVGANVIIFSCFNISMIFIIVCISWNNKIVFRYFTHSLTWRAQLCVCLVFTVKLRVFFSLWVKTSRMPWLQSEVSQMPWCHSGNFQWGLNVYSELHVVLRYESEKWLTHCLFPAQIVLSRLRVSIFRPVFDNGWNITTWL